MIHPVTRHSGRKEQDPRNLSRPIIAQFLQRHSGKDLGQLPGHRVRAAGLAGHPERLGIAAAAYGNQAHRQAPHPLANAASALFVFGAWCHPGESGLAVDSTG